MEEVSLKTRFDAKTNSTLNHEKQRTWSAFPYGKAALYLYTEM